MQMIAQWVLANLTVIGVVVGVMLPTILFLIHEECEVKITRKHY